MNTKQEFMKCINKVEMSSEIRREMEGVLDNMCKDQKLVSRYYNREEEERRIQEGIYKEIAENTKKEMIIEMYKDNVSLEKISTYSSLSSSEVEKIINDYLAQKESNTK